MEITLLIAIFTALVFIIAIVINYTSHGTPITTDVQDDEKECNNKLIGKFSIAGINNHDCSIKLIGAFSGYLEAEPTNNYDANAIKVMHESGVHLGYIKSKETQKLNELPLSLEKWPIVGYIKFVEESKFNGFFVGVIYVENEPLNTAY